MNSQTFTNYKLNKIINKRDKVVAYRRNHPFRQDWNDWQQIVWKFFDPHLKEIQKAINKGFRMYSTSDNLTFEEMYIIDEVQYLCDMYTDELNIIKNQEDYLELAYAFFKHGSAFHWADFEEGMWCYCHFDTADLFNNKCIAACEHLQAHCIAFMWAVFKMFSKKDRKRIKKYYHKLEQVILAMSYEHLKCIDFRLIIKPFEFCHLRNSLLINLYERFYFEKWTTGDLKELPFIFEYMKNYRIPKSQAGRVTSQCFSDTPLMSGELLNELYAFVKDRDFDTIMTKFIPKAQGVFSMDHNLELSDTSVEKLKNMLTESKDSFMESMKESLISAGESLGVMFIIATTCSLLTKLAVGVSFNVVLKMLHTIYLFVTGGLYANEIKESLAVSQSGSEISVPFLPTMILRYIIKPPKEILTHIWKSPHIDTVMRRIGFLGDVKVDRGIERIIDWIKNIIRKVQQWYGQDVLGMHCGINGFYESEENPVLTWFKEVDEISNSYFKNEFRWTEMEFQIILNLYRQGLSHLRNNEFARYKNDIHRVLRQLTSIMEKFRQKGINNQSIRNPPVTIYLYGDTGVGKSSITYPLAVEILKKIHDGEGSTIDLRKEWKNMIYMRAPEQEYWDGYENQLVTVFDDFSQQTDSLQNPNVELFEIIRSSNCFPYPLHMASLDQKANTNFTSKIIIVSSNLKAPQCASLNFPEALRRRFDICVQIKRKYTGHTSAFDPKLYELESFDMVTGIQQGQLKYEQFVAKCVDAYFYRKNFVSTIENYIDHIFTASEEVVEQIPQSQGGGKSFDHFQDEEVPDLEKECNTPGPSDLAQQLLESNLQRFVDNRVEELIRAEAEKNGIEPGLFKSGLLRKQGSSEWIKEIQEEENLKGKLKNPFYLMSYYIQRTFIVSKDIFISQWADFKKKHCYLSKAVVAFSLITASLAFLKFFFSLSGMFNKKALLGNEVVRTARSARGIATIESYSTPKVSVAKVESYTPPRTVVPKVESYTPATVRMAKIEGIPSSEGVKDINATEILLRVVRSNLYKMYESTRNTTIGHVMFLKGKIALMPKHFLGSFYSSMKNDPEAHVVFENVFLDRAFSIKIKDLLESKIEYESPCEEDGPVMSRDLMCFSVKTSIYHSDATNYFVTRGSMARVDSSEVMLPILVNNNSKESNKAVLLIRYARGHSELECVEKLPVTDDDEIVARYIRNAYMYNLDTQETECGAPLIVRNTLIQPGKICGIHIAGIAGTGRGWSTVIYKEDVVKILGMFDVREQLTTEIRTPLGDFPKEQGRIPPTAQFIKLGRTSQTISQPRKSKIVPSPLYGKIKDPMTKPCLLTYIDNGILKFDPREYRLNRLGNTPVCLDETMIFNSKCALVDEISTVFNKNRNNINLNCKSKYTFEEACIGIDGEEYINSVKRDTSSGFPFVCMKDFTRKDIFGKGEEYDLSSPQCMILKKRVENIIENAKKGIALDHIFVDTLKDERKPIEKCHKTRLFSAGPVDYLVACKMYFNGVVNLLSKNRNKCHISVGTNVYSNDWDEIVRLLHAKSKRLIAGDFEGFDASQHQRLLEAAVDVLIDLSRRFLDASEEDILVMQTLAVSLVNSIHIMDDLVYQWTHSLPSGHYLTAIINSIFVNLAFGCVYQIYKKKVSYKIARQFWNKCGIVAYGDDHLVAVPPSDEEFNQFTIPKFMEKLGLGYTMEDKEGDVVKRFRNITEVTYLKRSFLFDIHLNRYICPLNLDTILEFPMWNHKCPDPIAQTIVELDKCIEELSLHPREVWDKYILKLLECGRELGYYSQNVDHFETRMVALGQKQFL